jgi:hypothetical protein
VALDAKFLDERRATELHFADSPQAAVQLAVQLCRQRHEEAGKSLESVD